MAEARASSSSSSSEESVSSTETEVSAPQKMAVPKKTIAKVKSTHSSIADMVNEAIVQLEERGGSSLLAIKKFIATTYNRDADKLSTYIKKYVKSAVVNGDLVQTTGRGASGSFKLPTAKQKAAIAKAALEDQEPAPKKTESKKVTAPKKQASSTKVVKKASSTVVEKKKSKMAETTDSPKSPPPTKKAAKSPKAKAQKPKKAAVAQKSPKSVPKKMTAVKK